MTSDIMYGGVAKGGNRRDDLDFLFGHDQNDSSDN